MPIKNPQKLPVFKGINLYRVAQKKLLGLLLEAGHPGACSPMLIRQAYKAVGEAIEEGLRRGAKG